MAQFIARSTVSRFVVGSSPRRAEHFGISLRLGISKIPFPDLSLDPCLEGTIETSGL